jgi:hypothetical protein
MIPPSLRAQAEDAAEKQFAGESAWMFRDGFLAGVEWLFSHLQAQAEGEWSEETEKELAQVFYFKMNCCPQDDRHSFVEGARHQHALSQALVASLRDRIKQVEAFLSLEKAAHDMTTDNEEKLEQQLEAERAKVKELEETLSRLAKVPTKPYEKAMAKEIVRLRAALERISNCDVQWNIASGPTGLVNVLMVEARAALEEAE